MIEPRNYYKDKEADTVMSVAGSIVISAMVRIIRLFRGPRAWRGGPRSDTGEQMRSCKFCRNGSMGTSIDNMRGNQMVCRKSDQFIVPEKSVKADGGKGLAHSRFK